MVSKQNQCWQQPQRFPPTVSPHQPQKTPGVILEGTQEAALLSPVELSAAGIPASLKNPFCQKSKPLTMILFYCALVMKPQKLGREKK